MASLVSKGVALGVIEVCTPRWCAYCTSSWMSGRFSGSPPVSTNTGTFISAIWSISPFASAVESSNGLRCGCAQARQWTHARSQAWVVSQMTMYGFSLKSSFRGVAMGVLT